MYKYIFISGTENSYKLFSLRNRFSKLKKADSVWQEHAKYSPKCIYVSNIKEAKFVLNSVNFKNYPTFYVVYSTMCVACVKILSVFLKCVSAVQ